MKHYRRKSLDKFIELSLWTVLLINTGLLIAGVLTRNWIAFIHYIGILIIIVPLWNIYYRFYPAMEKLAKELSKKDEH